MQAPINELCADDDEPELMSEKGSTMGDEEGEGEDGEDKDATEVRRGLIESENYGIESSGVDSNGLFPRARSRRRRT